MIKEITVVLISHKSRELILKFIKNLKENIKILVIENSSDFDLENEIQRYKNVEIKFMKNNGYGAAINYARTFILSKYFFVFSPDITSVDNKLIDTFIKKIKILKSFGALGPRFINVTEKSHKQSNINYEIGTIDSISGSAMCFDTSIFDDVGGFDENIFLYFEETDYCRRAKNKGYKIYQINETYVDHSRGAGVGVVQTTNTNEINKLEKLYSWHFVWSKYYFLTKHYGKLFSLLYFVPVIVRILYRISLYKYKKNINKKEKYQARLNGLISSIKGMKSYKRL